MKVGGPKEFVPSLYWNKLHTNIIKVKLSLFFFLLVVHKVLLTSGAPLLLWECSQLFPLLATKLLSSHKRISFLSFFFYERFVTLVSKSLGNTAHLPPAMFHLAGIQHDLIELITFPAISMRCCGAPPNRRHYSAALFFPGGSDRVCPGGPEAPGRLGWL